MLRFQLHLLTHLPILHLTPRLKRQWPLLAAVPLRCLYHRLPTAHNLSDHSLLRLAHPNYSLSCQSPSSYQYYPIPTSPSSYLSNFAPAPYFDSFLFSEDLSQKYLNSCHAFWSLRLQIKYYCFLEASHGWSYGPLLWAICPLPRVRLHYG